MMRPAEGRRSHRAFWSALAIFLIIVTLLFWREYRTPDPDAYPLQYQTSVERYAEKYDIPVHLVYAVIRTESSFDPRARSSAGAQGLMQIMPDTFRWLSDDMLREKLPAIAVYDPDTNIRYGCYYLRWLYDRYGSWLNACAAYNAGPGTVAKWLEDDRLTGSDGLLNPQLIPLTETQQYVLRIERAMEAYDRLYEGQSCAEFRQMNIQN